MQMKMLAALAAVALSGCATNALQDRASAPVEVKIIALNDFHGNLEKPNVSADATDASGATVKVPTGGAAWLAAAVQQLREQNPNHAVISAGDLISASPLTSSLFLDEPTVTAMNMIGLDFNAAGNHEFDRGRAELLRMQNGGCEKHTSRQPCRVEPFQGASFGFLAGNTVTEDGGTLFPAYGIRSFGEGAAQVKVGFIGLTLKGTNNLVIPSSVAGLTFADEAATANALVPRLKAEGADAIILVIHEGGYTKGGYQGCEDLSGPIVDIMKRLDPAIDVIASGHTHRAYVCDNAAVDPARPFLLTSAGTKGAILTDITLSIDPVAGRVVAKRAENILVQNDGYDSAEGAVRPTDAAPRLAPDPRVAALVSRYAAAAKAEANRIVAPFPQRLSQDKNRAGENALGSLIADAQLAAARAPAQGGAELAFMNSGGVRAALDPGEDGQLTFGDLYAVQPFGNIVTVLTYNGAQIRRMLEQQYAPGNTGDRLLPSHNVRYSYDARKPQGQQVSDILIDGRPVEDGRSYRLAVPNFLASGGGGITVFTEGRDPFYGVEDIEALEAYLRTNPAVPVANRITQLDPE